MRRSLAKIPCPVIGRAVAATSHSVISTAFSTSSGGGRGRGGSTPIQFTVGESQSGNSKQDDASAPPHGHGRGRGEPLPSFPAVSSISNNNSNGPPHGRGRGFIPSNRPSPGPLEESQSPQSEQKPNVKLPFQFIKDQNASGESGASVNQAKVLPSDIINVLSGAGRGRVKGTPSEKPKSENRHVRQRPQPQARPPMAEVNDVNKSSPRQQLTQEEKVRKAVEILSKGGDEGPGEGTDTRPERGRGGGRGRGRGGRRKFDVRGKRDDRDDDDENLHSDDEDDSDSDEEGLFIGDDAEGEKMAQKLGPETMDKLDEAFDEVFDRVLPDPEDDEYVDALHTNFMIECEPEYLMEEFGTNPDIDDKPIIPLRDALEKMKPFLMTYEGIQTQEKWEEVIEETMKNVPLMQKIVDDYGGPNRVTAKQQQKELERVAKTLPTSAPASVTRFTQRALLSLQSNPGWGFDKKCQYMDKLVMEVSQQYK